MQKKILLFLIGFSLLAGGILYLTKVKAPKVAPKASPDIVTQSTPLSKPTLPASVEQPTQSQQTQQNPEIEAPNQPKTIVNKIQPQAAINKTNSTEKTAANLPEPTKEQPKPEIKKNNTKVTKPSIKPELKFEGVAINKSEITSTAKFFPYSANGTRMEVFAVKASDGTVRTALNTCQICYDSGRGYYVQEGNEMVCQNCGNRFGVDDIEVVKGGCNPVPILAQNKTDDGKNIYIPKSFLEQTSVLFSNWKSE